VRLDPWQRSLLANAFGWVHDGGERDGKRRFRKVLLYIAKKNGKSTLLGGLAVYAFTRLKEGGAKVLTAATHRGQARNVWEVARDIIEADPGTLKQCIVWNAAVQLLRDRTAVLEPISGEAKGEDGADCFFAILDELHRQNDTKLPTILDRGGSGRAEAMFWILTTADEIRPSPCNTEHQYALSVRANRGDKLVAGWNPAYLPAVYELDEGDDWKDERTWSKANPGLGTIKSLEAMRALAREAVEREDARVDFQRLDLNLRVQNAYAPLKAGKWQLCAGEQSWIELRKLMRGRPCYLGADLAETNDMISLVAWFPEDGVVLPWYWACDLAARERFKKNEAPYLAWKAVGALELVTDDAIELEPVVLKIEEIKNEYRVLGLGVDRAKALELCFAVRRFGIEPIFVGQGWATMTEPCDWLVRVVENRRILHGNHPVLNWNAANLRFKLSGQRGKQPMKPAEAMKIDGISAWLTARAVETGGKVEEPPGAPFYLSGDTSKPAPAPEPIAPPAKPAPASAQTPAPAIATRPAAPPAAAEPDSHDDRLNRFLNDEE
jgi:phage terminase large subunit-like protein